MKIDFKKKKKNNNNDNKIMVGSVREIPNTIKFLLNTIHFPFAMLFPPRSRTFQRLRLIP